MKTITAKYVIQAVDSLDTVQQAIFTEVARLLPIYDYETLVELRKLYQTLQWTREELLPRYTEALVINAKVGKL